MANKQIATILVLKDKMSQPMFKINKNVDKVTKEMKKSRNEMEKWKNKSVKAMDSVIKKSVKVVGAGAAIAGAFAVGTGIKGMLELEESSAKVKSIAGEALELNKIQEELLKNSTKAKIDFNELADAQYAAISSGVDAAESIDAAVSASKLAKAGFTDTESALKLMTSTMNVFGMKGTDAMTEISDKMLTTQNLGVTSVNELANSLGSVTPIAKAAGIGLDDVLGSVGALTKGGQATSEAMTGLKGMISNIIKPSTQASKMAKKLGIDFSTTALKNKGFPAFLQEIKEKTGGNTDQMAQLFGSVQGLNAVLSLTSDEGFTDFNNILGEVKNSAGMTEKAYGTMTNTIGFKIQGLKNTAKNLFTEMMNSQSGLIGEYLDKITTWVEENQTTIEGWIQGFAEGIGKMIEFVKSVVDFVTEHQDAILAIVAFIGGMYATVKVIALVKGAIETLIGVGALLNGTIAMTPIGWIIMLIGALVAAGVLLWKNWETVIEWAGKLKENLLQSWEDLKTGANEKWDNIVNTIKEKWEGLKTFLKNPVKGTVELFQKNKKGKEKAETSSTTVPAFAKGTSYSPGGWARINEEGGEIRKLSSGETIIPADKSDRLFKNKTGQDIKIEVIVQGNVIGNKQFINEVGEEVYTKVKLALDNI